MANTKVCPVCRRLVGEDAEWCPYCGARLAIDQGPVPSPAQAPPQYQQQWQQPMGQQAGPRDTSPKGRIIEAVRSRSQSDEVISEIWAFLPIISVIIVGIVAGVLIVTTDPVTMTLASVGASIIATALLVILLYRLFKRNNNHTRREAMLRVAMIDHIKARAVETGSSQKLSPQIQTMESINYESMVNEPERSAVLWDVLPIVPVVGWIFFLIALYYLTSYAPAHDRRWHAFTQQTQSAGSQLGMTMILPSWKTLPERSFIIYLILTIVTFGIFIIYWYYVLIKDMNEHYRTQWQFEDQLLGELQ